MCVTKEKYDKLLNDNRINDLFASKEAGKYLEFYKRKYSLAVRRLFADAVRKESGQ